jgi:hypothetical protein
MGDNRRAERVVVHAFCLRSKSHLVQRSRKQRRVPCSDSNVKQLNLSSSPSGRTPAFSRLLSPELCKDQSPLKIEGAGKAGYRLIPAAPVRIKMHGAGTTGSAGTPGLPCAMV